MKKKVSIILNILIVIIEIFALIISFKHENRIMFEYYTIDSNLLALIGSLIYLIIIFNKNKVNEFTRILKYVSVCCLTVTFLVVIFVLLPMLNFNYKFLLLDDAMSFHHVICPLLSIVTFIWFDDLGNYKKKDVYYPVCATITYAFVLILLNFAKVVDGPYPFLRIYNQTILSSLLWFAVIICMCYLISKIILTLRINKKSH